MVVLKFGGTSVGTADAIRRIVEIIKDDEHRGKVRVVVVSALSGVTDTLISLAEAAERGENALWTKNIGALRARHYDVAQQCLEGGELAAAKAEIDESLAALDRILGGIELLGELSPRSLDQIESYGELSSSRLITRIFRAGGIDAAWCDSREVVKTDDVWGHAEYIKEETYAKIREKCASSNKVFVAPGFIASTDAAKRAHSAAHCPSTTLGRGGSDLSAAIYGAALDAETVEIWTDVNGILTADPRLVPNAFTIEEISYTEALELSHFGAKVLHPPTVRPALEKNIPIRIRNTFIPGGASTLIINTTKPCETPIRGLSAVSNITLVRVQGPRLAGTLGFAARLFGALARSRINIILITQASSEYSICFAIAPGDCEAASAALEKEFEREIASGSLDKPIFERDMAIIAVVGANMKEKTGIAGKIFHALGRRGISVKAIAQGSSEINVSAVVAAADRAKAMNAVHEAFFHGDERSVNVFLIGTGLIGGALLAQIAASQKKLAAHDHIKIRLVGIANSKRMIIDENGINPKEAQERLGSGSGDTFNLFTFISTMTKMRLQGLPNTCFCDCTADDAIAAQYGVILRAGVPVVTPNKRANSGSFAYYHEITSYARERGVPYLYETTVCAGLPVISILRDLRLAGDTVRRIEAVLSGTLSYIFNNYDGKRPFSALVREARDRGYTEPDPREDLKAADTVRKALILARECGMPLEPADVEVEPLISEECFRAKDVPAFFAELEKYDAVIEKKRAAAAKEGRVLRSIVAIENGKAKLTLRAEDAASPFRSLVDSDNIVVVTTDRYAALPLVVKGPGAGAEVTAGGVFADIIRVAAPLV